MEDFAGRQSRAIEQISEQTAVGFVPLGPFGRTHKIELERDVRGLQQIIVDVGNDRDAIALSQRFERRQNIWVKLHLLASSKKVLDERRVRVGNSETGKRFLQGCSTNCLVRSI